MKKALELIGGKWKGGKTQGFEFNEAPGDLLQEVANGKKVNIQKEYQYFATPSDLAFRMASMLEVEEYDMILEPSAGQGALIKMVQVLHPDKYVHYCELMPLNRTILSKLDNVQYMVDNFLKLGANKKLRGLFHRIIANPPFSSNQDIDHINLMYDLCAPGGRIVTLASKHWQFASDNKSKLFRIHLKNIRAEVEQIPAGTFQESGTNIETVLITINKH